ncbi:MAG: polysaccharide deacetylase family protein [Patescibacteria group bacterium]
MLKKSLLLFFLGLIAPLLLVSYLLTKKSKAKVLGTSIYEDPVIRSVKTGKKVIALTFDDGPSPSTEDVLANLRYYKIPATFFMVGNKLQKFPDIAKQIMKDEHEIGNHTNTHPFTWMTFLMNQKKISQEILIAEEKIYEATGARSKMMRSPFGWYTDNLFAVVGTLQYKVIGWDVDPEDWRRPGKDKIVERVLTEVKPGSIILLHDGPYTADRSQTIAALPEIIQGLWDKGYHFVTVSELLKYDNK